MATPQILFPRLRFDDEDYGEAMALGNTFARREILHGDGTALVLQTDSRALHKYEETEAMLRPYLDRLNIHVDLGPTQTMLPGLLDARYARPSEWYTALFLINNAHSMIGYIDRDDIDEVTALARSRVEMIRIRCPSLAPHLNIPAIWELVSRDPRKSGPTELKMCLRAHQGPLIVLLVAADPRGLDRQAL